MNIGNVSNSGSKLNRVAIGTVSIRKAQSETDSMHCGYNSGAKWSKVASS